jgi:hypothetical protein
MSSYVSDASRHAVCGEMASAIGVKDSVTKDKLAFETIEIALSKAREVRVEDSQVPYLCQFCQFWHLGKNIRIGLDERIFYIPKRETHLLREEVKPDRPLARSVAELQMLSHNTPASEVFKLERLINQNKLQRFNLHKLQSFAINPQYRAIIWALHMPAQRQPVFLKTSRDIVYRSRAGDYWGEDIEL